MEKFYKVSDHKYLHLTITESPIFALSIQQIMVDSESDFVGGVPNPVNTSMVVGLTFPEFTALSEFMVDWMKELKYSTDTFNQLVGNKKEE